MNRNKSFSSNRVAALMRSAIGIPLDKRSRGAGVGTRTGGAEHMRIGYEQVGRPTLDRGHHRVLTALLALALVTSSTVASGQNTTPSVTVTSVHHIPGTGLVHVAFDVEDLDGDRVDIRLYYSDDQGGSWQGPCATVSGDVGPGVEARIGMVATWNAGVDLPGANVEALKIRVYADDRGGPGANAPEGFVYIAPGTFEMGSPTSEPQRFSDMETQHTVTLTRGFYMSKYEVTEQWWAEVMGAAPTTSQLPKVNVSWDMAVQFCNALSLREGLTPAYTILGTNGNATWNRNASGYRLPTEAEWEYACRAGTTTAFHNGTNCLSSDTEANYDGRAPLTGCPSGTYRGARTNVGSFPANAWGLHDMHGNVWEWVWDGYRADYQNLPGTDPVHDVGPGSLRVGRGGSWLDLAAQYCRSAVRGPADPTLTSYPVGFRPVRSAF